MKGNGIPGVIFCCAFKFRVQLSHFADDCCLNDSALKLRFRLDQSAQLLANGVTADQRFTGSRCESGLSFVQSHDSIEIAGIKLLLELTRPILWSVDQCCRRCW